MIINDIFLGTDDKLRSGWRFAIFVLSFLIAAGSLSTLMIISFRDLLQPGEEPGASWLMISSLTMLVPALLIGWLCGKYLEGLPFEALGA